VTTRQKARHGIQISTSASSSAQAVVGILGFWFHLRANLVEPGHNLWDRLVNGAPPLSPMLFPNLGGLAFIGLWRLIPHAPEQSPQPSWPGRFHAWTSTDVLED
jgi:hypothetical protein